MMPVRTLRGAMAALLFGGAVVAPLGAQGSRGAATTRASATTRPVDLAAARALIARVVPASAASFNVAAIPDSAGLDVFEVESQRLAVMLRGSSGVAIASALNWYLEHVAGVNVSLPLKPIALRTPLPRVPTPVRISHPLPHPLLLQLLHLLLLHGVVELERLAADDRLDGAQGDQRAAGRDRPGGGVAARASGIRVQPHSRSADFLVGPAYLPWGWMGNIDGLGGPLPDSWIDSHITLERQILARERALGMTPGAPGVHRPRAASRSRRSFPAPRIHQTGDWSAGFSGTWFLDPQDSLFQRFGRRFIERADGAVRHRSPVRRRPVQ